VRQGRHGVAGRTYRPKLAAADTFAKLLRRCSALGTKNQEIRMKHVILSSMLALGVACGPMVMADEAMNDSSSHHFVKDSAITTKVKAKLAAKHLSTLTKIKVDTDENGVVWLSGRAPTQDASDLAAMIAKNTEGVNSVHNDIAVEP
jgi:hyperosmotically inducible periplasmic protein